MCTQEREVGRQSCRVCVRTGQGNLHYSISDGVEIATVDDPEQSLEQPFAHRGTLYSQCLRHVRRRWSR